jgi:hypothetical protein
MHNLSVVSFQQAFGDHLSQSLNHKFLQLLQQQQQQQQETITDRITIITPLQDVMCL